MLFTHSLLRLPILPKTSHVFIGVDAGPDMFAKTPHLIDPAGSIPSLLSFPAVLGLIPIQERMVSFRQLCPAGSGFSFSKRMSGIARSIQAVGIVLELVRHPITCRIRVEVGDVMQINVRLHAGAYLRISPLQLDLLQDFFRRKRSAL